MRRRRTSCCTTGSALALTLEPAWHSGLTARDGTSFTGLSMRIMGSTELEHAHSQESECQGATTYRSIHSARQDVRTCTPQTACTYVSGSIGNWHVALHVVWAEGTCGFSRWKGCHNGEGGVARLAEARDELQMSMHTASYSTAVCGHI
jgi:hypothetical protein